MTRLPQHRAAAAAWALSAGTAGTALALPGSARGDTGGRFVAEIGPRRSGYPARVDRGADDVAIAGTAPGGLSITGLLPAGDALGNVNLAFPIAPFVTGNGVAFGLFDQTRRKLFYDPQRGHVLTHGQDETLVDARVLPVPAPGAGAMPVTGLLGLAALRRAAAARR